MSYAAARSELYVYYRVASAHWRDAAQAVRAFQRHLCAQRPGLSARVLRRPDERSGEVTLMEIYRVAGGGVDAELEARIAEAAADLAPWCAAEARHVERFHAFD